MGVKADIEKMVIDPSLSLASSYHDAGSCWQLIDAAIIEIRRLRTLDQRIREKAATSKDKIDELVKLLESVNIDKK